MSDNSFEASLNKLEKIVEELEKGETSLEDSIKLYEEGIKLANNCKISLNNANQKIITLTEAENNG